MEGSVGSESRESRESGSNQGKCVYQKSGLFAVFSFAEAACTKITELLGNIIELPWSSPIHRNLPEGRYGGKGKRLRNKQLTKVLSCSSVAR